jgi:Ca2+-binding EF-hand superfamily protein
MADPAVALLGDLRVAARRKGLVLEDLFKESDRADSGSVSYAVLRRIVTSTGFWCNESQLAEAIAPFYVSDKEFRYRDFLAVDGSRPPSRPSDDLREFALDLQERGIELSEALALYNTHHTGRVSSGAFRRLLGDSPLNSRIVRQFEHPSTHEIDYVQLSREVRKLVSPAVEPTAAPSPRPFVDASSFLGQVATSLCDQRIDIRSRLGDLDRRKKQRLPRRDFIREVSSYHLAVSPQQLEQLADAYADTNGDVDYGRLADDVEAVVRPPKANSANKPDIAKTLAYLKDTARNRHSQIEAALRALDPSGSGVVAAGRFARCLDGQKFRLEPGDLDALKKEFGNADGNIEYERFLAAILPAAAPSPSGIVQILARLQHFLADRKLSLKPMLAKFKQVTVAELLAVFRKISFDLDTREVATVQRAFQSKPINIDQFCDPIDYAPPAPPEGEAEPAPRERQQPSVEVIDILIKLDAIEKRTAVEYGAEFRRHDSFRKGEIAVSHFKSILLARSSGLTPTEVDVLAAFYRVSPQQVNYGDLLQDKLQWALESPSTPTDTAAQIIDRLREILTQRGIRADELFARQDRQKSGKVFAVRVRSILDSIGLKLSEHDEQVLREEFPVEGAPEMFDYQRMCALIARSDILQQPEPQDREKLALASSLRERIQARKKRVRDAFPDGTPEPMPDREFRNALQSLGLAIREAEMQRILKYYRTSRKKEVDWQQFVTDVETSRAPQ